MPNADSILAQKDRPPLVTIDGSATVLDAAKLMNEEHIGSLVVVEGSTLVGIFTERDVLRRVVAECQDPSSTKVSDVMTTPVACAKPDTPTEEIAATMREKRIRHLPVLDGTRILGMVSIGDLNRSQNRVQAETILYFEQFLSMP